MITAFTFDFQLSDLKYLAGQGIHKFPVTQIKYTKEDLIIKKCDLRELAFIGHKIMRQAKFVDPAHRLLQPTHVY